MKFKGITEQELNQEWMIFGLSCVAEGAEIKCEEPTTLFGQTIYKISVPEKNETVENYSPEAFMKEIKEYISEYIYKACEVETEEDKEEVGQLFKVLGKVRNETWTKEKQDEKMKQIEKELDLLSGYKEV